MAIIIDIKDAIRDSAYNLDNTLNFNFNEIETVDYPYLFFYIPSFRLEETISSEYWRKLTLLCVLEYAKSEDNNNTELWTYIENLSRIIYNFNFKNTKLTGRNAEYKIVDGVLQVTFDLEFYVKEQDADELMRELIYTLSVSRDAVVYGRRCSDETYCGADIL